MTTRTHLSARQRGLETKSLDTGEVTRRILEAYEVGDLVTTCAWCNLVEIDGEWLLAPRAALTAIDSKHTLSHSICPRCAAGAQPASAARNEPAQL